MSSWMRSFGYICVYFVSRLPVDKDVDRKTSRCKGIMHQVSW